MAHKGSIFLAGRWLQGAPEGTLEVPAETLVALFTLQYCQNHCIRVVLVTSRVDPKTCKFPVCVDSLCFGVEVKAEEECPEVLCHCELPAMIPHKEEEEEKGGKKLDTIVKRNEKLNCEGVLEETLEEEETEIEQQKQESSKKSQEWEEEMRANSEKDTEASGENQAAKGKRTDKSDGDEGRGYNGGKWRMGPWCCAGLCSSLRLALKLATETKTLERKKSNRRNTAGSTNRNTGGKRNTRKNRNDSASNTNDSATSNTGRDAAKATCNTIVDAGNIRNTADNEIKTDWNTINADNTSSNTNTTSNTAGNTNDVHSTNRNTNKNSNTHRNTSNTNTESSNTTGSNTISNTAGNTTDTHSRGSNTSSDTNKNSNTPRNTSNTNIESNNITDNKTNTDGNTSSKTNTTVNTNKDTDIEGRNTHTTDNKTNTTSNTNGKTNTTSNTEKTNTAATTVNTNIKNRNTHNTTDRKTNTMSNTDGKTDTLFNTNRNNNTASNISSVENKSRNTSNTADNKTNTWSNTGHKANTTRNTKPSNTPHHAATLLGFRGGCLQACAEVSVWTKFCEVEAPTALLSWALAPYGTGGEVEYPKELLRYECHLRRPPILHNALKRAQRQIRETVVDASERDELLCRPLSELPPLSHQFAEGPDMTLADLMLFACFHVLLVGLTTSTVETTAITPLVSTWHRTMAQNGYVQMALPVLEGAKGLFCGTPKSGTLRVIVPSVPDVSIYKSDPERSRTTRGAFTRQGDVEEVLRVVEDAGMEPEYMPWPPDSASSTSNSTSLSSTAFMFSSYFTSSPVSSAAAPLTASPALFTSSLPSSCNTTSTASSSCTPISSVTSCSTSATSPSASSSSFTSSASSITSISTSSASYSTSDSSYSSTSISSPVVSSSTSSSASSSSPSHISTSSATVSPSCTTSSASSLNTSVPSFASSISSKTPLQTLLSSLSLEGHIPESRLARKEQQVENICSAVLALARPGDVIVDFCSGGGHVGIPLAQSLPGCRVVLVENKVPSLERARDRVRQLRLSNVCFVQSNLDYFRGGFDIGVSLHACGVATDLVLGKCMAQRAAFVVVPCCYGSIRPNHVVSYPRSSVYRSLTLTPDQYLILGHAADQTHGRDNPKTEQGQKCMRLVDGDRLARAREVGYVAGLALMHPPTCSPKNHLLMGKLAP